MYASAAKLELSQYLKTLRIVQKPSKKSMYDVYLRAYKCNVPILNGVGT